LGAVSTVSVPRCTTALDRTALPKLERAAAQLSSALQRLPESEWPSIERALPMIELACPLAWDQRATSGFYLPHLRPLVAMVRVPGDDDELRKLFNLFDSFPWGRIGLDFVLATRAQHGRWFCRELMRAATSTTLNGITFLDEDDVELTRAESLLHGMPDVGSVWLGRTHGVTPRDLEEMSLRIAKASPAEVGAAICRQIERGVELLTRRYQALPSAQAVGAFVAELDPVSLDAIRVASTERAMWVLELMRTR
jgi:hypothetical protein